MRVESDIVRRARDYVVPNGDIVEVASVHFWTVSNLVQCRVDESYRPLVLHRGKLVRKSCYCRPLRGTCTCSAEDVKACLSWNNAPVAKNSAVNRSVV